jgi:hypothetical protein
MDNEEHGLGIDALFSKSNRSYTFVAFCTCGWRDSEIYITHSSAYEAGNEHALIAPYELPPQAK